MIHTIKSENMFQIDFVEFGNKTILPMISRDKFFKFVSQIKK